MTRSAGLAAAVLWAVSAGCASKPGGGAAARAAASNRHVGTTPVPAATTTTVCALNGASGTSQSVPIDNVCSSTGAPHFDTPQAAMAYLADAWNGHDVQEIDYVTDPAGRAQMDSMAAQMPHLTFKSCTQNPAGDDTCYFTHDIVPSTSPTTYPDPGGYPAGEAVFTVAPAEQPGWYLTNVIHCG